MTFLALVQLVGRVRHATLISTTALQTHAKTVALAPIMSTLTRARAKRDSRATTAKPMLMTARVIPARTAAPATTASARTRASAPKVSRGTTAKQSTALLRQTVTSALLVPSVETLVCFT